MTAASLQRCSSATSRCCRWWPGRWIEARPERDAPRERLAWWPVPLLAIVVFQIAAAQVGSVLDAAELLTTASPVFVVFLLVAGGMAKLLAHWMALPVDQGRTLAFSLGTRNSFVVLLFALSFPPGWELAAVVIVVQSLVELLGMVFFLWWVPRHLFVLRVPRRAGAAH